MKISQKIGAVILIGAVVSLVLAGALTFILTRSSLRDSVGINQEEIVRQTMDKIDRLLYERYLDIQSIGDEQEIERSLSGEARNIASLEKRITDLTFLTGPWDEILIADTEGHVVLSSLEADAESELSGEEVPVFQKAVVGKTYYSDHILEDSKPTIFFATPIFNKSDITRPVVGVAMGVLSWPVITEILGDFRSSSEFYLYSKTGKVIASSQGGARAVPLDEEAIAALLKEAISSKHAATENISDQEGTSFLVSAAPSQGYLGYRGNDWVLVIETPTEVALASARANAIRTSAFLIPVIGLLVLSILFFLRRFIVRPISELISATKDIASGNLRIRARAEARDELGILARSFNAMAGAVQESRNLLEKRVAEKTSALSSQVEETERSKSAILNLLEDIEGEKKKVEEVVVQRTKELQVEKARLLASINSLSFGFIIADKNDHILLQNPALSRILELEKKPASIHDVADSFKIVAGSPAGFEGFNPVTACKQCMQFKQIVEMKEAQYGKKSLRVFCIPVMSEAPPGSPSDADGYVFLIEDITEAKVAERSRDEFFAVASHELRTPLTAIRGNTDMLLSMYGDKIVDKDMKEMLTDINTSSIRLIMIVNDFLEASRLEQGKIEVHKEVFDVEDIIAKVVRDLKGTITQKGLALLHTPSATPLPKVNSDKDRVEQVVVNLVGNASKFTKEGSITIDTELIPGFIKIRVTDTGVGISEQNQARLFRKFQQAGESMLARDVTQSTGLGLYISRLMVSLLGGSIGLERSEPGKGSVFSFTVPTVS